MRPGRNAPDNPEAVRERLSERLVASMRPGRNAPDNVLKRLWSDGLSAQGFNEAGAKCPG